MRGFFLFETLSRTKVKVNKLLIVVLTIKYLVICA